MGGRARDWPPWPHRVGVRRSGHARSGRRVGRRPQSGRTSRFLAAAETAAGSWRGWGAGAGAAAAARTAAAGVLWPEVGHTVRAAVRQKQQGFGGPARRQLPQYLGAGNRFPLWRGRL